MSEHRYDAIVVGARCAGSATAMLLARKGFDVLVVDRVSFPSDTVSTHLVHAPGIAILDRWGLLDRLVASGCPPITTYSFDFGPLTVTGSPAPAGGIATAYCPRRTVLDALLVDAAREAGAEVREGFTVDEVIADDGTVTGIRGHTGQSEVVEHARVVVGADGVHSRVAGAVAAPRYRELPVLAVAYYSYWSGIPVDHACWLVRPGAGFGAFPTHDGLTMLLAAWPHAMFADVKRDIEGNYLDAIRVAFGDRLDGAQRQERIVGAGTPNIFRKPYGPGWALVGDAGYAKDPVTAQGITDAFRDAELCTEALDAVFTGAATFDDAMADYQDRRDECVIPLFEFTTDLARLEPPPPELQQLLGSIAGNTRAMNEFASVFAGTMSPVEFFAPHHVEELVAAPS
jgi:flavin-dependent dehydrogenase